MDRFDRKVLYLLQENATLSVADIAKRIGLSTTPFWRRIQKLEEDSVIQRRVAVLSLEKVTHTLLFLFLFAQIHTAMNGLSVFQKLFENSAKSSNFIE